MTSYTDDVSGLVIGDVTVPYEFWLEEEIAPGHFASRCLARNHCTDDDAAVAWFRSLNLVETGRVVEMRVFDQPPDTPTCPVCGGPMKQIRRGATLAKRGPLYTCPVGQAETQMDENGRLYRIPGAIHGPYRCAYEEWELQP